LARPLEENHKYIKMVVISFFLVKLIKYFILVVWLNLYYHYWWNKEDHKYRNPVASRLYTLHL